MTDGVESKVHEIAHRIRRGECTATEGAEHVIALFQSELAAVRGKAKKGWALVPEEPTDETLAAGAYASNHYPAVPQGHICEPVHQFKVTQMWRAMVKAALLPPQAKG